MTKVSKEFLIECGELWKNHGSYQFLECKFKFAGGRSRKIKAVITDHHMGKGGYKIYPHKLGYECAFITRLVDPDNFDYPRFECIHAETSVLAKSEHTIWTFTLAPADA